jgi:hypothetical protein
MLHGVQTLLLRQADLTFAGTGLRSTAVSGGTPLQE